MPKQERSQDVEIAKAVGQAIRAARQRRDWTQEYLGERAGMHATFISNMERGYRVPKVPTLLRIAAALDVPPSELLDGITVELDQ